MSVIKDFKAFVMRGNVVDLAVAVIIGTAFGKVVSSLVSDVIMPPIGLALGGVDFTNILIVLKQGTLGVPPVAIRLGSFIQTTVDFLIIAFAIFLVVRAMARVMPKPPAVVDTKACSECAMSIPLAAKRCGHCCEVQAR